MVCGAGCSNTDSDPLNCGSCGEACGAGLVCNEGACASECSEGLIECDGACVDVNNDPTNCGDCGTICEAPASATGLCIAGSCRTACEPLTGDCNGDLGEAGSDGCELSLATDRENCGGCGFECSLPSAVAGCEAGDCTVVTCDEDTGNCDSMAANGCETDTTSSDLHCGGCGMPCASGQRCIDSACTDVPGDTCSGAIALSNGANTVDYNAVGTDYLVTSPSCVPGSYDIDGPDVVMSYTATTDERVSLDIEKPTSTRWVSVVSTEACGTLMPRLACTSEYTGTSLPSYFNLAAGETAYIYVADTSSGANPLDDPLIVNVAASDCAVPPSYTLEPATGTTTATLSPSFTVTFEAPVDRATGTVTITGDMGTSLSYDLATAPAEVSFASDDFVMEIDPGVTFPEGEQLTLSWTGLQSAGCATAVAIPAPTWTVTIIDPPCFPGLGGLVGDTQTRISTGGFSSFSEYYVAADADPAGWVYVGGTSDLYRMRKTGGGVQDVEALAGLDFENLGYAMLIDGDNVYTLDSDTSESSRLWRISTDGGTTWTVEDYAVFQRDDGTGVLVPPEDEFSALTEYGGRIYLVTEEFSSGVDTEIWSVDASATTLPAAATLELFVAGEEDCTGIVRDDTYYYLACATGDRIVRVPVAGGASELLSGAIDLSFSASAIHGHDTDADGTFDALYIQADEERSWFMCSPAGTAPAFVDVHTTFGTGSFNYGLAFDDVNEVLWMWDDDNQQFLSVQ